MENTTTGLAETSFGVFQQGTAGLNEMSCGVFQQGTAGGILLQRFYWDEESLIRLSQSPPPSSPYTLTDEEIVEREKKIYEKRKEEFLKDHEGEYIALRDGKLLGSNKDSSELLTKIYNENGYISFYMPLVTRKEEKARIATKKFKASK